MSEHHVLNPRVGWDDLIQDNICPDYGFERKWPDTRVRAKAAGGQPVTRETRNDGHTFSLSWLNRSFLCVQKIRQFYNEYGDGYFTLIDRDGGGRHYVGRFEGDFPARLNANDSWDIRDLQFVEVPGAPMLQYPSDWQRDSVALRPFNDFGSQLAATRGEWNNNPTAGRRTLASGGTNAGDFLAMEYRGYGCQLWMRTGTLQGQVEISLDGAVLATVDLYSPAFTAGPQLVFARAELPLDLHRIKIAMLGTKNPASGGTGATFCNLQVMR